jgi:hypothetical protein
MTLPFNFHRDQLSVVSTGFLCANWHPPRDPSAGQAFARKPMKNKRRPKAPFYHFLPGKKA